MEPIKWVNFAVPYDSQQYAPGTPIVAVESGVVEAMGWNRYGGWRIGIRSTDNRRYHYYAHNKKDHPFADGLEIGTLCRRGI